MGIIIDFERYKAQTGLFKNTAKAIRILSKKGLLEDLESYRDLILGLYLNYLLNIQIDEGLESAEEENYDVPMELIRSGHNFLMTPQYVDKSPPEIPPEVETEPSDAMNTLQVDLSKYRAIKKLSFEQRLHVYDEWEVLTEEEFLHIHRQSHNYRMEHNPMGFLWVYEDLGKTIRKQNSTAPYELKVPRKRLAKVTIEYLD